MKGEVKFTSQFSDLPDGFTFSLTDGDKVVKNVSIGQNSSVAVSDIPNGIYTIKLPSIDDKVYAADDYYVYIREQSNEKTLSIKQLQNSELVDQSIKLNGLGGTFATLETKWADQQAEFTVTQESPHTYYEGKKYASISVSDANGNNVYQDNIQGTGAKVGSQSFSFKEGYKIQIYHAEPDRIVDGQNLINTKNSTNILQMTKYGLINTNTNGTSNATDSAEAHFIDRIEKAVSSDKAAPIQLKLALNSLSDNNRKKLESKYKDQL